MTSYESASPHYRDPDPALHEIDIGFEPLYSLTPEQSDRLINALFNLLIQLISRLENTSNPNESRRIAEQARDIFADYDDDLADILTRYLIASSRTDDAPVCVNNFETTWSVKLV